MKTVGQIKYKVTGKNTVTVNKYAKKTITKVSIPATVKINGYTFKVTAIADSAFSGCSKLTKVTVGSNVKTIRNKAFYKCTELKTVSGASNITKIENNAFNGCKALKKLVLDSKSLQSIGNAAFKNCTALTSITVSSTKLTKIGKEAFSGNKKLAAVTIKTSKLTKSSVGKDAFKNIKANAVFKVPSKKVSFYKTIFKAKGAGKNIKVKKM